MIANLRFTFHRDFDKIQTEKTYMSVLQTVIVLAWGVCGGLFIAYAAAIAGEITYVTLADGRKMQRRLPLALRLLLPLAPNLRNFVHHPRFDAARAAASRMIVSAGLEGVLTGGDFLALKFLTPLVWGGVWALFVCSCASLFPGTFLSSQRLLPVLAGFVLCYAYPLFWLRATLKARHLEIARALPFVLDLLTLSVEAGMDFMHALQRNCASRKLDALNEELLRMSHEIQIGMPRRTALQNMSQRVGLSELTQLTHALVQADMLGVSIGSVLRIQSEQLRTRRFERAEKTANEAPVKMLGPLLLFIFPAVFLVLLAPIVLQAAASLF